MKDWFLGGLFLRTFGRIWGAGALAFGASMIPAYIWRGSYYGSAAFAWYVEDWIMTAGGIVFGFLFLLLLQSRRKDTLYRNPGEIRTDAIAGVAVFWIPWVAMHLITHNNYLFAFCGYHTASLLAVDAKNQPKTWAVLVAALVYGLVYAAALLLGAKLAHHRAKRIYEKLKENEE